MAGARIWVWIRMLPSHGGFSRDGGTARADKLTGENLPGEVEPREVARGQVVGLARRDLV